MEGLRAQSSEQTYARLQAEKWPQMQQDMGHYDPQRYTSKGQQVVEVGRA